MSSSYLGATAIVVLALVAIWFYRVALPAIARMRAYSKRVAECGHLEPLTDAGLAQRDRQSHFFFWLHVGWLQVSGKENLDRLPHNSYLVTPNHGSMNDIVVLPEVLRGRRERYMATRDLMTCVWGLGAQLFGPIGVIATDLTKGKGGKARETAVKLLCQNEPLVMFPEGYSYNDGSVGEYKKGAVRIARESAAQLGYSTYIVPMHLHYGRYPGHWIMKLPIQLQYAVLILLSPLYRGGVKVVIGEPIASHSLPADDAVATAMLKQTICSLDSGKPS